ncbi:hypothetical protein FOXB_06596, partial [Fusarium oxysporum f. sp. conglutinans Fo5176]
MAAATRSKHHGAAHIQEPVASKGSPIAGKVQSPPKGGATQKIDPGFEKDVAIDEFIDHRVDTKNSTVDIQVKWQDGETTWESEWSLQEKVPSLVFKYWEKLDGRDAATNLDTYSGMQKVFAGVQVGPSFSSGKPYLHDRWCEGHVILGAPSVVQ